MTIGLAILAVSLFPQDKVSSLQVAPNLPKIIPSEVYSSDRSIVKLYIDGQFTCSGVVISRNYVLTAAHCMVDEEYRMTKHAVTVMSDDGKVKSIAKAVGVNIRMDWGLIQGDFVGIPGAPVIYDHLELEERVVACGYPHGTKAVVCEALMPQVNDLFLIKSVGILFSGMSGGPVFNHLGQVIGINVLVYPAEARGGAAFSPTVGILATFGIEP
jgi:V8-like Glu-specific endopeptidase